MHSPDVNRFPANQPQSARYRVYTGPTLVQAYAERFRAAGIRVTIEGTEHVYIVTELVPDTILAAIGPISGLKRDDVHFICFAAF